jgi:hypothetical protein
MSNLGLLLEKEGHWVQQARVHIQWGVEQQWLIRGTNAARQPVARTRGEKRRLP